MHMTTPEYQAPAGQGPSGPRASFGRRLVAWIIDLIVIDVVVGILFVISRPLGYIGTLISLAYFTYFEGSASGQTVGKKMLGIRVIDYGSGGAIGHGRAFIRWIGKIVSGIAC